MPSRASSNPAQRLHDLLERHGDAVSRLGPNGYDVVWADTFDVEPVEVIAAVATAFGLITEIDAALAVTDDPHMTRIAKRYRNEWSKAFVPFSSGRSQILKEGPSEESIDALGSVASHLRDNLPEGAIPDAVRSRSLHDQVIKLIQDVRDDESLPVEIREAFISRLYDMAWALDRIDIGGAGAIQAALDRLLLICLRTRIEAPDDPVDPSASTEGSTLRQRIWQVCTGANDLISAPGAWKSTADMVIEAAPQLFDSVRAITGS